MCTKSRSQTKVALNMHHHSWAPSWRWLPELLQRTPVPHFPANSTPYKLQLLFAHIYIITYTHTHTQERAHTCTRVCICTLQEKLVSWNSLNWCEKVAWKGQSSAESASLGGSQHNNAQSSYSAYHSLQVGNVFMHHQATSKGQKATHRKHSLAASYPCCHTYMQHIADC